MGAVLGYFGKHARTCAHATFLRTSLSDQRRSQHTRTPDQSKSPVLENARPRAQTQRFSAPSVFFCTFRPKMRSFSEHCCKTSVRHFCATSTHEMHFFLNTCALCLHLGCQMAPKVAEMAAHSHKLAARWPQTSPRMALQGPKRHSGDCACPQRLPRSPPKASCDVLPKPEEKLSKFHYDFKMAPTIINLFR